MLKGICLSVMTLFMFYSFALAELVDNGDGTVTDTVTGLMWQQAEAGVMTWEEALTYCENLNLTDHDDWRLPNRNELQSLVDYEMFEPSIDTVFFSETVSSAYWSSTTYVSETRGAWVVDFLSGDVNAGPKSEKYYVRAVRSGQ